MIRETHDILREAMDAGVADSMIPPAMARKLDESLFLFSGFKTAQELKDASSLLRRPDGSVKSFSEFYTDIRSIDDKYNVHYLEAEYNFAVASSQMAASWAEAEAGGDRYDLQYRTMGDSKVRNEHRALNGVTLPPDDPFWRSYYPPNGWNCRCTVRQVRRDKFPRTDPAEAMQRGDEATDSPKQRIFRFNPGIDGQLFPPKHPYYKVSKGAKKVIVEAVKKIATQDDYARFEGSTDFDITLQTVQAKFKDVAIELTDTQKVAIFDYTGSGYKDLNAYLGGFQKEKQAKFWEDYLCSYARVLEDALAEKKTKYVGEVYRGVALKEKDIDLYRKALESGESIAGKTFQSCSTDANCAFRKNTQLIIQSRRGVSISDLSEFEDEHEVLFPPSAKFNVLDIKEDGGITYIKMEEV